MAMAAPAASNASNNNEQVLKDLLERLRANQEKLGEMDPRLGKSIGNLLNAPSGSQQTDLYRTRLAYAVQDAERLIGPVLPAGALRQDLENRAQTYPGLNNNKVQDLLQQTRSIQDSATIQDIRTLAANTAKLGGNQQTPEVLRQVEAIENRLQGTPASSATSTRNAQQTAGTGTATVSGADTPNAAAGAEQAGPTGFRQQASPAGQTGAPGEQRARPADNTTGPQTSRSEAAGPGGNAPAGNTSQPKVTVADGLVQGFGRAVNAVNQADNRTTAEAGSAISNLLHAMTSRAPLRQANDGDTHTPVQGRLANFREAQQNRRDDAQLSVTERAGAAAIADVKAFTGGPASTIMQRIRDAATFDPKGMAGVLEGMRPGGRYQDFGEQIQRERTVSPAFAASQDKAIASLATYGNAREAAAAIAQRRGEAAVTGRLERLDAEVGREAGQAPGKGPGQSMLQEMTEKVREVIQRAVDRISAAFTARPSAAAGPSPAP